MVKEHIARSLLGRAHSPDTTGRIFTEKVTTRRLHLKPTEPSSTAQHTRRLARQQKLSRKKKQKPAPLSARQKRGMQLYDISPEQQKYAIYEPLHRMWIGYIQELLWEDGVMREVTPATAAKLCSADFHGAEVEVVRSRCVGRVGTKGIVVRDSRGVFEVVTKKDAVKILPKEHTIFRFLVPRPVKKTQTERKTETEVGERQDEAEKQKETQEESKDMVFELHGEEFQFRAADRATRKFKPHFRTDL
ncbi:hypothetical protein QTJ16_006489 [Diplocarpon rosae]|uniref:Ribonuclease P protein subunit n=1 Tax=Diplocarpon rosae TaxID=946125 RepID=A0AAD9SWR1_9HELO|nr:hypothetical protein QTJ16_006489 [Diplocarpon rosae]